MTADAANKETRLGPIPKRFGYAFCSGEAPRPLDLDRLAVESNGLDFRWIGLHRDNDDTNELLEQFGLDALAIEALEEDATRPRCTAHGQAAVIILRGVNLNPGAEPEDMISLRLWVEAHQVIGVWVRPLQAVRDLISSVERGYAPASPGELIAKLALRLADRAEPIVAQLNEDVDRLEEHVLDAAPVEMRGDLARIRRSAIVMRRYMFPQRDALSTLEIEDFAWIKPTDRMVIREAANRVTRLGEELDAIRERASIVYDELMVVQSEAMNKRMLMISIVAAIFLPLSLLTGLLGMNVGGIPGVESKFGFAIVTGLVVVLGILQFLIFKRLKLF